MRWSWLTITRSSMLFSRVGSVTSCCQKLSPRNSRILCDSVSSPVSVCQSVWLRLKSPKINDSLLWSDYRNISTFHCQVLVFWVGGLLVTDMLNASSFPSNINTHMFYVCVVWWFFQRINPCCYGQCNIASSSVNTIFLKNLNPSMVYSHIK